MSKNLQRMDILPKLPPDINFDDPEILKKTLTANIALAELNSLIFSIPNYEVLLVPLTAREAVASSEIENIHTTTLDLLQAELFPENKMTKDQKETMNYKDALLAAHESISKKGFLSTNQIIEIQKIIEPNKSGIRKLPGTVIMNGWGEVIYRPPQDEKTIRNLMQNWEDYSNDFTEIDCLVRLAILHYQFESIHPFYDGNGRTGRILMVMQMILENRLQFPVLFLSGYILKTKGRYYELLQKVRTENLWKEWIIYILEGIEKQSLETKERIGKIKTLTKKSESYLEKTFPKLYIPDFMAYLFGKAFFSQKDMIKTFGINRKTASKYLHILHGDGFFKMKVVKKQKIYFNPEFIKLLS